MRKKDLVRSIGRPLSYIESDFLNKEYTDNGILYVTGPDVFTKRDWNAIVTMENGLIKNVM